MKEVSEEKLNRNIRAHGNFSEYVPLYLLLLLVSELVGVTSYHYMLIASLIFTYGRIAHAICFAFFDYNPFLRISGHVNNLCWNSDALSKANKFLYIKLSS